MVRQSDEEAARKRWSEPSPMPIPCNSSIGNAKAVNTRLTSGTQNALSRGDITAAHSAHALTGDPASSAYALLARIIKRPLAGRLNDAFSTTTCPPAGIFTPGGFMYHVWILVDDEEVKFSCNAWNRNEAAGKARAAYPAGSIVSVLPA